MSSHVSDHDCPGCDTPHMYAWDESSEFGYHNPYLFQCVKCNRLWRWTDKGKLKFVEYEGRHE